VNGEAVLTSEVEPLVKLPGPQNVPQGITENCARCHGLNGLGRGQSAFPKIAGQKPDYLELSMQAYARGERLSGIMQPVAAGFSQAELQELARYYASLPEPTPHATTASQERGQQIALHGIPSQRVPACVACHGPSAAPRNPVYPKLAGQYADYLELQLLLFKEERRGGTAYAHLMRRVAAGLTAEQMREVTLYYASLPTAAEPEETAGGK
jgi:cytochrome c553